eukprot:CAMPEP_0196601370 /NCGR_PEP_ID=MMETSP1081-20130531/95873_1 /TAXON_ID=36882 /ORGANISM="Pyramimonas amylifera, Strain CCMP720" /LENGTH=323 /DNA_ID=CAMNT_0041927245 /DNA_START=61 /DNA_END=1032 /DNA_ORIENTATION=-
MGAEIQSPILSSAIQKLNALKSGSVDVESVNSLQVNLKRWATSEGGSFERLETALGGPLSEALSTSVSGTASCPLCRWLYEWFCSDQTSPQRFVLACALPTLIWMHAWRSVRNLPAAGYEAVLNLIYRDELAKKQDFPPQPLALPSLFTPSPYHTPPPHWAAHPLIDPPETPPPVSTTAPQSVFYSAPLLLASRDLPSKPQLFFLQLCALVARLAGSGMKWAQAQCVQGACPPGFTVDPHLENGKDPSLGGMGADSTLGPRMEMSVELYQVLSMCVGYCLQSSASAEIQKEARLAASLLKKRATFDMNEEAMLLTSILMEVRK